MTMFTTVGWWGEFWANLAADLLVALAVGIILAQYLGIRSERNRRGELRQKALELILEELRSNRDEARRVARHWSEAKTGIAFMQTGALRLASENRLLQDLDATLAGLLLKAYAELGDLENRSPITFDKLFELKLALRTNLKGMAEAARSCSETLHKAIQALEGQSSE